MTLRCPVTSNRALSPGPRFSSRIAAVLGGELKSYRRFPVFVVALLAATSLFPGQAKNSTYSRVVSIDHLIVHEGSRCAAFASFISSDEFFEGLEATESASGRTFHRRGEEVTVFPDSLSVEIKSSLSDCSTVPPIASVASVTTAFMSGLTFKTWWKTGFKQRPVDVISFKSVPPQSSALSESEPVSQVWTFTIKIASKGVPLTDHLVVEIYSKDGAFLGRMAAHL
jgi:hypothetical protein